MALARTIRRRNRGSGAFCRNGPKGDEHKRLLTAHSPNSAPSFRRSAQRIPDFGASAFATANPRFRRFSSSRRATVLILVVGVLAMLFIIGSTLLIVARFERQTADKFTTGQNMDALLQTVLEPVKVQLIQDVTGENGIAYDRAWNPSETSAIEDSADFPGIASGMGTPQANWMRSGDLLLSSVEPYYDPTLPNDPKWFYPWVSSALDGQSAGYTVNPLNVRNLPVFLTWGAMASRQTRSNWPDSNNSYGFDVSGDGVRDLGDSGFMGQLAGAFGTQFLVGLRVVPHGGMVLIDPFTHPVLLAQVIHPEDGNYHNNPGLLFDPFQPAPLVLSATDEGRLRRRMMLPESLGTTGSGNPILPSTPNDLRAKLPVTTGYKAPGQAPAAISTAGMTPHFWPADDQLESLDNAWWQYRLLPPARALTETGYNAAADTYDRRRLITTANSDDLLRVNREESRLANIVNDQFLENIGGVIRARFKEVLTPQAAVATDIGVATTPPLTVAAPALPWLPPYPWGTTVYPPLLDTRSPYLTGTPLFANVMPNIGTYTQRFFDYGRDDDGVLRFNVDGLRTPFSLRDVLDPYIGQGTYQKVTQLTAYFLAMIQHTSMPGSDVVLDPANSPPTDQQQLAQIQAAAQLAVNTIDFADNDGDVVEALGSPDGIVDQVSTYFAWPPASPTVQVIGVEKQPYLTEAYVKLVIKPDATGTAWDKKIEPTESIYAVELYNPYEVPLSLRGYQLNVMPGQDLGELLEAQAMTGVTSPEAAGAMRPHSYIVFANHTEDAMLGEDPFIPGSSVPVQAGVNLFTHGALVILPRQSVQLLRMSTRILELTPTGFSFPAVSVPSIVIDEMSPDRDALGLANADGWADHVVRINPDGTVDESGGATLASWPPPGADPDDRLVRDTSLQRHKELISIAMGVFPPTHWHFALNWQVQFPLSTYESWDSTGATEVAPGPPNYVVTPGYPLGFNRNRPPQHRLLANRPFFPVSAPIQNPNLDPQVLVRAVFEGAENTFAPFSSPYSVSIPVLASNPIAGVPVVTSDVGIDRLTGGTRAFPTTGTLLLVNRYSHGLNLLVVDPTNGNLTNQSQICAGTQATYTPPGVDYGKLAEQLQHLDNGHMPLFASAVLPQTATDLTSTPPEGRLDAPWGQLVYNYFTALPLEELTRRYNFAALDTVYQAQHGFNPQFSNFDWAGAGLDLNNTRLAALPVDWFEKVYSRLFPFYPLVDRVSEAITEKGSPIGPKVRGRININQAPWWVLDGLPALAKGAIGTVDAIPPAPDPGSLRPTSGVPLREVAYDRLDPISYIAGTAGHDPAGQVFSSTLFDQGNASGTRATDYYPSVSPTLARYMTSYAQGQPVPNPADPPNPIDAGHGIPGFTTVGNLLDVLTALPVTVKTRDMSAGGTTQTLTMGELRAYACRDSGSGAVVKPYAYLNYLQFVGPLVRIQDWVTVKNHVFTIYATAGDLSDPQMPLWMRTQVTVDRTACLYKSGELPQKITETPPIAYQNALDDK